MSREKLLELSGELLAAVTIFILPFMLVWANYIFGN